MKLRYSSDVLKRIHLAPIAGYTDLPFRSVAKKYGWENRWIPLFPVHPLTLPPEREKYLTPLKMEDRNQVLQIFGGRALDALEEAFRLLKAFEFAEVNVNAGCPVPKVNKAYGGGYLMKDLRRFESYVSIATRVFPRVSVKCRLGWDKDVLDEFVRIARDHGVRRVVVHPRLVKERFSGKARWERVFEIKEKFPDLEVILSGDVKDHSHVKEVLRRVDGVMIGRWAVSEPWLLLASPAAPELWKFVEEEISLGRQLYGDEVALRRMRKKLLGYVKGGRGASETRKKIAPAKSWEEVLQALKNYFWGEYR